MREPSHGMRPEHMECRALGHKWEHIINHLGNTFHVYSKCERCGYDKEAVFNRHGWRMTIKKGKYPDGYLFPKGKSKTKQEVRDALFNGRN